MHNMSADYLVGLTLHAPDTEFIPDAMSHQRVTLDLTLEMQQCLADTMSRLGDVEAERDRAHRIIAESFVTELLSAQIVSLNTENAALRERADRAERILAALREPTEKVTRAAVRGYSGDMVDAIRDAVAAAEQEVDRG